MLLLFTTLQVNQVAAVGVEARVVSIQYPTRVIPAKQFQVVVVANYSDSFLVDVGIWDPQASDMVQSVTLISSPTGPGPASFTFQLTAPSTEEAWNLTALTRVWFHNAWYQDPIGGAQPFTVTIGGPARPVLTLSIRGVDSSITVDGTSYQLNRTKSLPLQLSPGFHTLEANQTVTEVQGQRYVFVGWSDGVQSNLRQIVLAQDTSLEALYRTEFYLAVNSNVNKVSGSGWYEQGSQASFGVDPSYTETSWFGYVTYQYEFSHWSGDSSSTNNISLIIMNSPKTVDAEWVLTKKTLDPIVIAYVILLACLPLAARTVYLRSRRENETRTETRALGPHLSLIALLLTALVLVGSVNVPAVNAEFVMQPKATTVQIGDALWYYWNQTGSDTCLLWLGGGVSQGATDVSGYYWINPFAYESFGTIQFIQKLAQHYCVIALEQGSENSFDSAANRTIFQEVYSIQSTIIGDVHNWIRKQGYAHTYIIGYSVGGQAAALEVTLRDPTGWTSQDGLVLITVPFSNNVIEAAVNVHLNLLLLYGGNLPDYEATGLEFYNNAPSEGWHGASYLHKQFLMLQEVGHELWTVRDTGAYSPKAENAVVSFIEKSKALQFTYTTSAAPIAHSNLTSVKLVPKTATDQPFILYANVTNPDSSNSTVALIAYDLGNDPLSSTIAQLTAKSTGTIRLVMPAISNSTQQSFNLLLLEMIGNAWIEARPLQLVNFPVANMVNLNVSVSIPNTTLTLDGSTYTVPSTGTIQFKISQGRHAIQVQPLVQFGNRTREIFTEWEDESAAPRRTLFLDNDTGLSAIYRRQYFVNGTSQYGTVAGSGWYDEQAVAVIRVQPPIDNKAEVIFSHWTGDSTSGEPRILLTVDAPKTVTAQWDSIQKPIAHESATSLILVALSLGAFAVLLILNLRKRH